VATSSAEPAGPKARFQFSDSRITEASGIARGIRSPGVLYVQNDSGDEARFFALDATTGQTLAVYTVPGATNIDWEDLSVATDSRGVPSIWIADIGDNDRHRAEIRVYQVEEPAVDTGRSDVATTTSAPQIWRLAYPDGAHDAEGLAVAPGGAMYLFDKVFFGPTEVYAVPLKSNSGQAQPLTNIGSFATVDTGTRGGPNPIGRLTVTGASLSRDGTVLAVRTYTDAYLWRVGPDGIAAALKHEAVRVALPEQPQGEGITVDSSNLLVDSETAGSTVWSLPLPDLPTLPSTSVTIPPVAIKVATDKSISVPAWAVALIGAAAVVLAFGVAVFARKRARTGR
jgi:outer membrane protein assembly factor BamB